MFQLTEIIASLCNLRQSWSDFSFSEAVIDSRQGLRNCLFVAIPGENTDGHSFLSAAFEKGAKAALVQQDTVFPTADFRSEESLYRTADALCAEKYCIRVENTVEALQKIASVHRRNLALKVIGITGSVGKSTTKELTAEVLSQHYSTLKNEGNLNNEIGLPLTLLQAKSTHRRAVLEMGFYVSGEIDLLCRIAQPEIGVITNIGTVHAERAGSQEMIARGKSELIQALPPNGTAILNYDDPWVLPMAQKTHAHVFTYGLNSHADLWADEIESNGLEGIRFRMNYQGEQHTLRIPLIGRHSVHTALRATAVGIADGLSWPEIFRGLNYGKSQLRMTVVHSDCGATVIDDTYNASPESMMAALNLLSEMPGEKVAVLGDMNELGQYEEKGHRMVGIRAAQVCDQLIAVGQKAKTFTDAALQTGLKHSCVEWYPDVNTFLVALENKKFGPQHTVLVKGSRALAMERIVDRMEKRP